MNLRERIVTGMVRHLEIEEFHAAELFARQVESLNRESLAALYLGSLETDKQCRVEAPPDRSTPEYFGACLAGAGNWWDDHHDFDLAIPETRI